MAIDVVADVAASVDAAVDVTVDMGAADLVLIAVDVGAANVAHIAVTLVAAVLVWSTLLMGCETGSIPSTLLLNLDDLRW